MGIVLTVRNPTGFADDLAAMCARVSRGAEFATREGADMLLEAIRSNMNGPLPPKAPGADPARRTGNLFGSVRMDVLAGSVGAGRWNYEISVDTVKAPYAQRIEFGFRGSDSLGRFYDQPEYPYFWKGVEQVIDAGLLDDIYFANLESAVH